MSILLESLKQSEQTEDNDIPSLSDSHFDDEMLSDEWLLTRVRFWKLATFSLLFLLFLVLVAGIIYWPEITMKPTDIIDTQQIDPIKQVEKNLLSSDAQDQQITEYQPKILKPQSALQHANQFSAKESSLDKQAAESSSIQNNIPVNFESLSDREKRDLPELAINSFAVSSNPEKSFIVLNGSFYGPGEIIAPHLKLVLIDKDGIVVKHNNRLIRIKHNSISN